MYAVQEGLEFLGFFGMCAESIKIISSSKKIFFQITLTLILPLSIVFFCHSMILNLLTIKIIFELDKIFDVLLLEHIEYWVTEATYFILLVIFSFLSTSIVVYTVVSVYFNNQTTYNMVMSFIPKVWNSLLITVLCNFAIFIVYNIFAFLTLVIFLSLYPDNDMKLNKMMQSTIHVLYFIGFVYICVIGQLSSVISVLEESYGFRAIAKSKTLIKGKMGISAAIFFEANLCLGCINLLFDKFVVFEDSIGVIWKIGFGGLIFVFYSLLFLFGLVVQTVIYFVCEYSIHNSTLSNHLDVYLNGYFPLASKVVRFEQV